VYALESDTAYANVHTVPLSAATNTAYPGGEIRGQVHLAKEERAQPLTAISQIAFGVAFLAPKVRNGS
jgi:hypothetical protein